MTTTASRGRPLRRVEHHMGTAISLSAHDADDAVADRFFARVASYELVFSRFRAQSEISRLARGDLDPNALAKGWIVQRSALVLRLAGITSFSVNAGGDVLIGDAPPERNGWRVGVRHPERADAVVAVLDLARTAIATSGTYERGDHIRAPGPVGSGGAPPLLISVSVVGPDLAWPMRSPPLCTPAVTAARRGGARREGTSC